MKKVNKNIFKLTRDVTASNLADHLEQAIQDDSAIRSMPPSKATNQTEKSLRRVAASSESGTSSQGIPLRAATRYDKNLPSGSGTRGKPSRPPTGSNVSNPASGSGSGGKPSTPPTGPLGVRNTSQQRRKHPGGPKQRRPFIHERVPLPELGQPGGWDDPLRIGLSGAGVKWYHRYLAQGFAPDVARNMAAERNAGETSNPVHVQPKRRRDSVTPQQRNKRRKNDTPSGGALPEEAGATSASYATVAKVTKVAVLPSNFPQEVLTREELADLEDALVKEMSKGWHKTLLFGGIHFRQGYLVVDCEDQDTVEWLTCTASSLVTKNGVGLVTKAGEDIPKPYIITAYLPKSRNQSVEETFSLLRATNNGLNTDSWKVLRITEEESGQILVAGIDHRSREYIMNHDYSLRYRFGKIQIKGLKKPGSTGAAKSRPLLPDEPSTSATAVMDSETNAPDTEAVMQVEEEDDGGLLVSTTPPPTESGSEAEIPLHIEQKLLMENTNDEEK